MKTQILDKKTTKKKKQKGGDFIGGLLARLGSNAAAQRNSSRRLFPPRRSLGRKPNGTQAPTLLMGPGKDQAFTSLPSPHESTLFPRTCSENRQWHLPNTSKNPLNCSHSNLVKILPTPSNSSSSSSSNPYICIYFLFCFSHCSVSDFSRDPPSLLSSF